jgi:hypothetical protein
VTFCTVTFCPTFCTRYINKNVFNQHILFYFIKWLFDWLWQDVLHSFNKQGYNFFFAKKKWNVQASYVFTKLSSHSCNLWLLKLSNKYQMLFLFRCIHTVHESRYIYILWLFVLPTYMLSKNLRCDFLSAKVKHIDCDFLF